MTRDDTIRILDTAANGTATANITAGALATALGNVTVSQALAYATGAYPKWDFQQSHLVRENWADFLATANASTPLTFKLALGMHNGNVTVLSGGDQPAPAPDLAPAPAPPPAPPPLDKKAQQTRK